MDVGKIPAEDVMDIDVKESGSVTIVAPRGDIDMAVADDLRQRLIGLVDKGRARLVLDLGAVMYIDSAGLGVVVAAMKHARAADGDIKLCALESDVRAVLEMTHLNKVLAIHATRQEAIAAWA